MVQEGERFDPIAWWKEKHMKFHLLSRLVAVISNSITSVASKATFSAQSRFIDPSRALLFLETVQMLTCR